MSRPPEVRLRPPDCPALETLAAFVEAKLAGSDLAAVVAHLADCDACRETVVEASALFSEARPAAAGEVLPFPERRTRSHGRLLAGALAAALLLALAGAFWLRTGPTAERTLAALAGTPGLAERLGADWSEPLWSVTRGEGPRVSEEARAFRLGVRSAGLELALALGDRRAARRFAAESALLVGDVPLADPIAHLYRELARRTAEPDEDPAALAADAATAAQLAREAVDPALWELGRWSETGRLATASGAPLRLPRTPRLPDGIETELAELARRAARPELAAPPEARARDFARLVARGGDLR
jgi:hypothetical protein